MRDFDGIISNQHGSQYRAVLFDLDGVLVDSQGAENAALIDLAARLGHHLSVEDARQLFDGRRVAESVGILLDLTRRPAPPDAIEYVRARAEVLQGPALKAIPNVASVLERCQTARYVVSNSPVEMIRDRLDRAELGRYFCQQHFSAYEVGVWKPDPGLYLHAAQRIGIPTSELIAIEDSDVGVRSAACAGIDVLWFAAEANRPVVCPAVSARIRRFSSMLQLVGKL